MSSQSLRPSSGQTDIHPIQAGILKELVFHPERRFSELNAEGISSDQFSFNLRRLTELNLVRKTDTGYELTATGKEFANRFDTDSPQMVLERQAKIGVSISCVKKDEAGKDLYLIQQRLKQPYFGYHGFITGKVRWGETILETATRELQEETGLSASMTVSGVKHKMDYSETGELLEDKYFFVVKAENPTGTLRDNIKGGKNAWFSEKGLLKLPDVFDGVDETVEIIKSGVFQFVERKYTVKRY